MSDDIEVTLMVLERVEYEDMEFTDGTKMTNLFPARVYVLGINDMNTILELSPTLTVRMRELGFDEWRLER